MAKNFKGMPWQRFIDHIPQGVAVIEDGNAFTRVNDQFRALFGTDWGTTLDDLIHHAGLHSVAAELKAGLKVTVTALAGKPGHYTLHHVPMDESRALLICSVMETEALQACRSLIAALLQTGDGAVFAVDSAGYVTHCNAAAASVIRDDVNEITGEPIRDLLSLRYRDRPLPVQTLLDRAMRDGGTISAMGDVSVVTRHGTVTAGISVTPVADSGAAVILIRDMEEHLRMREEFRSLQHANNVVRAAGALAADLGDKLTALQSDLELFVRQEGRQHSDAVISRINRVVERFQRFTRGSDPIPASATALTDSIMDVVDLALYGSPVRSTFALDAQLSREASTPEGFGQALYNVVVNAVEAMSGEGVLHVEGKILNGTARRLQVTVRDEGHGIDPALVPVVTAPYMTTKDRGSGMGLAVTRSILERHGGELTIETDPGFGTTVRMEVFLGTEADLPLTVRSSGTSGVLHEDFSGLTVLLVEGDVMVRNSVERILASFGSIVISVSDPDQAVDLLRRRMRERTPVDLLITERVLPGRLDGVALLGRLRELNPDLRAILAFGGADEYSGAPFREAGFQVVLRKPFGVDQLQRALRGALA